MEIMKCKKLHHKGHKGRAKGVLTSSWSRPKNCSPDAHASRAFLNGDFKIVRHAHRESCRANCRQISRGDGIAQLPQSAEMRARAFGIFRERRNSHQSANLKIGKLRNGRQYFFKFRRVGGKAMFAAFVAEMNLQQYRQALVQWSCGRVESLCQA